MAYGEDSQAENLQHVLLLQQKDSRMQPSTEMAPHQNLGHADGPATASKTADKKVPAQSQISQTTTGPLDIWEELSDRK